MGDDAAIGPAIAALRIEVATTQMEAALLLYDHAIGPEAGRIRAAIARADAGEDAAIRRVFREILVLGPE